VGFIKSYNSMKE